MSEGRTCEARISPAATVVNGWGFLMSLHRICHFQSRERGGEASNSELRRWILNGAVVVNGEKLKPDEPMDFPIISFVLFPKKRVSLF